MNTLTESQLLEKARSLTGLSFHQIADAFEIPKPKALKQAKGWFGQCLETILGATAGNQARPDFIHLGIELKTIPLSPTGQPLESTYVCHAPLPFRETHWEHSCVFQKLQHVLWIPLITPTSGSFLDRRLGHPFLWKPNPTEYDILKRDWEELAEYLLIGQLEYIHARLGTYLHLRPKAPNSQDPRQTFNAEGAPIHIIPKGFYLRTAFTRTLLKS